MLQQHIVMMQQQVDKTDELIQEGQAMNNVMHGGQVQRHTDKHLGGQEEKHEGADHGQ